MGRQKSIYGSAMWMIRAYGVSALERAQHQMQVFEEKQNREGVEYWQAIANAIGLFRRIALD
jgi:hypothetical protein